MTQVMLRISTIGVSVLLTCAPAWAQATAQLSGTVRDESGAVLPGVTVTITQTNTGFIRTVVTEGTGVYVMPNLPLGPYRLDVSLQGFSPYSRTGIVLQVGAAPVINVVLQVGTLEESVTVDAAAPLVDVQSAGISEVVENERIVELPLQGRQVTDLIILAGGAVNTGDVSGQRGRSDSVAISVAGGLRTGVGYVLDGAMHNEIYDGLNLPFPFPDALQEFSVATGGLSAEHGVHSAASVNAVTKSGANRFAGNAFDFLRHHRFNATNPFAPMGRDGTRTDDGLVRNQYGGTLGGPIVRDKLFFFGGYQGTRTSETPASFIAWVPTPAMLAGDFTAFASPACNGGRQVTLRAPFVNNRIDPALLSRAAVKTTESLPGAANPCGEINYSVPLDNNDKQGVARVDYQWSPNHSLFGRYMDTIERRLPTLSRTGNILTVRREFGANKRARATSSTFGDTLVIGSNVVNSFRLTWNKTSNRLNDPPDTFFDANDLGIKLHTYVPGVIALAVTDGFTVSGGNSVKVQIANSVYQMAEDVTAIRGRHQMTVGANLAYWTSLSTDYAHTTGTFSFNGQATGLGLADFLTGQASQVEHTAPGTLDMSQWYLGLYAQDAWRATNRVTLNVGLRWEPYFGQSIEYGAIPNFILDNFRQGVRSTQYRNAPAGIIFPGDPGFPGGRRGMNTQWWNLAPRAGVAWDVTGNGTTAVRSSYGWNYDFPTSSWWWKPGTAPPFSNRALLPAVPFEDPYRNVPGGETHPIPPTPSVDAPFPAFAEYQVMDPDINSTRVQTWNVTVERQIGAVWQASLAYIGSYADRLWGAEHLNPAVFLGLGPCTLNGVRYATCTTNANLNQRRTLSLEDPALGVGLGYLARIVDVGTQSYRAVRLSARRRATSGLNLSANYTLSHCEADTDVAGGWIQPDAGYQKPDDPSFDRGNCLRNLRQIANVSLSAETPRFASSALRAVASNWRLSGILNARSGNWLTVTTLRDPAGTGINSRAGQRVDQVLEDPYGDKTLRTYLNRSAFVQPEPGTLGDHRNRSIEGPGYWSVDLALSRLIDLVERQNLELRVEVFNLFNNFNWGDPVTNFDSSSFGRITSMRGTPRIMQFGVKYGF
ncbi:MAG: TonB-dependent receptor [Acidobacteria bacterium]|nr:TonB-dependent receptor [Acidobacteriota bacterium]